MSILEQIKAASISARKARDTAASGLLTTLLSDVVMVGKNAGRDTTDAEAVAIVKKFVNNNNETIGRITDNDAIAVLNTENMILDKFLPQQMSEAEIKEQLTKFKEQFTISNAKEMGKLLGHLKAQFGGQYDGAVAAKIAKEMLA